VSDNFIVSARKYRPVRFEDVIGQESVTSTLQNAIKGGQLAHAYLFCGPRGVGKTTCARILSREVNGFEISESGDASTSLNIFELDAASNNSVDDIRNLVDQVRIPPQYGKYKVYIIDEVHMLSASAFNAFLKTLEEPPPYAIFILATTEKHKILPTILSRCQIFDFARVTVDDITKYLAGICKKEKIIADESALHLIAQKSDGAMRDSLSMLDRLVNYTDRTLTYASVLSNLNILDYDYYFRITDHLLSQDHSSVLLLFDEILRKGFDGGDFISGLEEHFRNLMVGRNSQTVALLEVTGDLKQRYLQQSALIPTGYLLNAMNLGNLCEVNYKNSNNKRLHVELTLIKMCYLNNVLNLSQEKPQTEVKKNSLSEAAYKKPAEIAQVLKEPEAQSLVISRQSSEKQEIVISEPEVKLNQNGSRLEKPKTENRKPETSTSNLQPSNLTGSLSFSDLQIADEVEVKEERIEAAFAEINPEKLEVAWNEYTQLLASEKRVSLQNLMKQNKPAVEGAVVTVVLGSKLSKELFDNERIKLAEFLESKLGVRGISLMAVVEKKATAQPSKPFTAAEKFRKMAEENPAILELQKRLDLKLEH